MIKMTSRERLHAIAKILVILLLMPVAMVYDMCMGIYGNQVKRFSGLAVKKVKEVDGAAIKEV